MEAENGETTKNKFTLNKGNVAVILVAAILIFGVYAFIHNSPLKKSTPPKKHAPIVVAKPPQISLLPKDSSNLSVEDKKAYDEISTWVNVSISNQPTLGTKTQTFSLPKGWIAREDYLLTVVPQSMPANIRNFRSVIFRPAKPLSREDAIYTVPDSTNAYFKGRCHITTAPAAVCYGGTNPATKHTFELMWYFSK